jgi:hypothetical protein
MDTLNVSELIKDSIALGTFPKNLYKFRKLNSVLDKILINNELKFSSPYEFNDPFDCRIKPEINITIEDLIFFIKKNKPGISDSEAEKVARANFINKSKFQNEMEQSIEKTMSRSGICCFSKTKSNILLWSHYSEDHKGVCLNFDVLKDPEFFSIPLFIQYQKEYPIFNFIKEPDQCVSNLIKTKSIDWCYEEEIRINKPTGHGLYHFKKESLVEIIFGCQSDDGEIEKIKIIAKANGYKHLRFSRAKQAKYKFELEFEEI